MLDGLVWFGFVSFLNTHFYWAFAKIRLAYIFRNNTTLLIVLTKIKRSILFFHHWTDFVRRLNKYFKDNWNAVRFSVGHVQYTFRFVFSKMVCICFCTYFLHHLQRISRIVRRWYDFAEQRPIDRPTTKSNLLDWGYMVNRQGLQRKWSVFIKQTKLNDIKYWSNQFTNIENKCHTQRKINRSIFKSQLEMLTFHECTQIKC